MEMVAHTLASAILDGEDPKDFLKRMSAKMPKRVKTDTSRASRLWDEWEELEDWAKVAATELEEAENMEFELISFSEDRFSVRHGNNFAFEVFKDEDTARAIAVDQVRSDLNDSPENFNQDWLQGFIDIERLRRELHQDARDDDYWNENNPDYESKLQELIDRDWYSDDPRDDTDGEITPELEAEIDEKWEDMIESFARTRLEDPIGDYLGDIYGQDEAVKKAIEIAGINIDEAAENAVATDGWQHFLAHYDGHSHDLPSGAVYVRQ